MPGPGDGSEGKCFLAVGLVLTVSELWKQLTLTFLVGRGAYIWWYFPWQLCSMPMYICVLIYISEKCGYLRLRQALITFLADFSLMSGIVAFFDTSGFNYTFLPLTVHSYLWHIILAALGAYAGTRAREVSIRAFFPAAFIYLAGAALAELFNLALDRYGTINMFYINPHYEMGQIVFRELGEFLPNAAVIILYILASIAGGFIFHLLWMPVYKTLYRKH